MSNKERGDGDIERYGSSGITSVDDGSRSSTPTRRSGKNLDAESPDSLADAVSGSLSQTQSVTVESESASATLVGVPQVDIGEFVFDHQQGPSDNRSVALFDVHNKSESPLRWQSTRTQFIGSDEYTYNQSQESLNPATLGPGCHTRQVKLPPGRRARIVTLVEELPPGVEIVEVVQTLSAGIGTAGNERLVFSI